MGRNVGMAYAEGFIAYNPMRAEFLPVHDTDLARAAESEAGYHRRADRFIATKVELPD
jgi:hypothetical protein